MDISIIVQWGIPVHTASRIVDLQKSIIDCYLVKAEFVDAKSVKGVRAAVYKSATDHVAFYGPNRSESIWYDGQSSDLHISLVFMSQREAMLFQRFLGAWHLENPLVVKPNAVRMEEVEVVTLENGELKGVSLHHYDPEESESPLQTLEDLPGSRASSVGTNISSTNPIVLHQSIEKPSEFMVLRAQKCHIKARSKCRESEKLNPNNLMGATIHLHKFFDGLGTIDPVTGEEDIPLVAIKPLGVTGYGIVGEPPKTRKILELEVEFRHITIADTVNLKEGSIKINDLKYKTSILVEDAEKCRNFFNWTYDKTKKKWKEVDTTQEEMMNRD